MSDIAAVRSGLFTILTTNVVGLSAGNVFKYAPSNPPDSYPFAFIAMQSGDITGGEGNPWVYAGFRHTVHNPTVTLCFSLQSDLADAEKNAEGYVKKVVDAIGLHQTLNNNVSSATVIRYEVGQLTLRPADPQTYYALTFHLWIQEIEEGTLTGA